MKIKELVRYWDKHARGRLTPDLYDVSLSDRHKALLESVAELYPMKSREDLIRDLVSAALDELETSFPYVQGSRVVALDEEGYEIFEDAGITPRFVHLSQEHMRQLKERLAVSAA